MAKPCGRERQAADRAIDKNGPNSQGGKLPGTTEERLALLSAIFARSPEGMAFVDPNLVVRAANASLARQLRVPLDQIVGRHGEEVVPGALEQVEHLYKEVRATGKTFQNEAYPFVFKEQPERGVTYWSSSISPVYAADGSFLGYLLLQCEVTERQRLGEDLARLAAIVESCEEAIKGVTSDGLITDWNAGAERLYGYRAEEIKGKPVSTIVPPERRDELSELMARLKRGERITHFETVRLRKDGTRVDVSMSISPIQGADGKIIAFSSVAHGIANRRRAEDALRKARDELEARVQERTRELAEANEQLRREVAERQRLLGEVAELAATGRRRADELEAVIASMADAVYVCDKEGRVVELNAVAERLFGLANKDNLRLATEYLIRLNLRHADGRPVRQEDFAISRALRGEVVGGHEEVGRDRHTGRDVYLFVSTGPVRDREGNIVGAVAVMSDITRLKQLDRLKDQFIAVAAHELKTPVAIMKGYAQAMLRPMEELPPRHRRMLEAINRGADRIDRVVNDLLDVSRLHLGHLELAPERINLPEFIMEVVDRTALTATKHRLRVASAEPVVVRGDRDRLEQVVVNLVENAMKYSPKGGDIDVAVTVREEEAIVSVQDYGVGIAKEKQPGIFQRFYSAHTGTPYDYGGMGAGLFISKEIITRHGGRMWFESVEGQGTTFYFSLPLR